MILQVATALDLEVIFEKKPFPDLGFSIIVTEGDLDLLPLFKDLVAWVSYQPKALGRR